MTMQPRKAWIYERAKRVEAYYPSWLALRERQRRRWNRMDGKEQEIFDADCKRRAAKLHYRAWDGDIFIEITVHDYNYAVKLGLPATAPDGPTPTP